MTLIELQAELTTGPLAATIAPLIAAGNDGAIETLMNAPYTTTPGAIGRSLFAIWVAETGMRGVIRDHALDVNSPLRSIALSIEDFLQGAAETLDFAKAQNVAMLSAWVVAGGCTQEQADDLLARAGKSISRAEQVFGESVSVQSIAQALRG